MFQIGTTNNILAEFPRDLEAEYNSVRLEGSLPQFGFYTLGSLEFSDVSFPISGISDRRALEIALDKSQRSFFKIYPNGIAILTNTGIVSEKPVSETPS